MAENTIRMSQLVGMFGPGAMLDLPDRSVLVLGLDQWEMQGKGTFQKIEEPRLQRLLHLRLKDDDRIVGRQAAGIPNATDQQGRSQGAIAGSSRDGVSAMVCVRRHCRRRAKPSPTRPIPGSGAAEARSFTSGPTGRSERPRRSVSSAAARTAIFRTSTGVASSIRTCAARRRTPPTRRACAGSRCGWKIPAPAPIRATRASSANAGRRLSLEELFQPGRLGACFGERPWIASTIAIRTAATRCLRLLTRSATNTYFPQVARVISLPQAVDALARSLEAVWTDISECKTVDDVKQAKKFNSVVRANLQGYSDEEILARVLSIASGPAEGRRGRGPEDRRVSIARERAGP